MPPALQFLVLTFAGWVNRHQDDLIAYLREENRVLREHLGPRPLRLTDAQRRRLAVRGQKLGRCVLMQVAGIVTPDTRSGPRNLDSGLSEISIVFQAAVPKPVAPKYTTSGVRRPSEL